jgi:hypothetical protein
MKNVIDILEQFVSDARIKATLCHSALDAESRRATKMDSRLRGNYRQSVRLAPLILLNDLMG